MLVDYGCHVFRAAVTDFDVFIEYGVELVVWGEVLLDKV